ncbi:MAG: carboxymuconolactone decarboxylase family protein [Roseibium sp.]|uniref:carboxymuconolactone decarboxylase family protein n=1 Tax=Roseibium sp. TaxID=1936156 RepID=UPI002605F112|nr:carboxymuconolactone decarboxylase family protein [Roseibium sp.]MCV0428532.1 carboxymuconolactone decarboxylase family protein [Roseibium sp.]
MAHLKPLDLAESREAAEEIKWLAGQTGFVANSMLTLSHRPEIARAVLNLIRAVVRNPDGTVDPALLWMVAHVTSLSNGCQYCSAHTFKNGADNGVPQEKLEALWEFETSPLFSNVERAALRVALSGGQCPASADPGDMEILRAHFSTAQIVEICSVIALFGFNNRWNALMETELEESVETFLNSSNYNGPDATA